MRVAHEAVAAATRDQDLRGSGHASTGEEALREVERVPVGADFLIEINEPAPGRRNSRYDRWTAHRTQGIVARIDGGQSGVVAARGYEKEVVAQIHRRDRVERGAVHSANLALKLKG